MSEIESPGQDEILEQERRRKEAEAIYGSIDDVNGGEDVGSWEELFAEADTFTITKLTPGVRDPNRVNVFLDGHFAFSLDIAQVIDMGVKVKQKVDKERLKILRGASEFGKLYQRTLEWALTRPHSVREAENYLKRRKFRRVMLNRQREQEGKNPLPEFDDQTTKLVVERLIEKGYLDDAKFAKYYVENRKLRKGISPKRMRMEMRQKGIKDEYIDQAFLDVERPEEEEIKKIIRKKRAKYDDFKLVGYLMRQGLDLQKAKDAVENYNPDEDESLF